MDKNTQLDKIRGSLVGGAVGYEAMVPEHVEGFKDKLELHDVILHVADDLWRGNHTMYNH